MNKNNVQRRHFFSLSDLRSSRAKIFIQQIPIQVFNPRHAALRWDQGTQLRLSNILSNYVNPPIFKNINTLIFFTKIQYGGVISTLSYYFAPGSRLLSTGAQRCRAMRFFRKEQPGGDASRVRERSKMLCFQLKKNRKKKEKIGK